MCADDTIYARIVSWAASYRCNSITHEQLMEHPSSEWAPTIGCTARQKPRLNMRQSQATRDIRGQCQGMAPGVGLLPGKGLGLLPKHTAATVKIWEVGGQGALTPAPHLLFRKLAGWGRTHRIGQTYRADFETPRDIRDQRAFDELAGGGRGVAGRKPPRSRVFVEVQRLVVSPVGLAINLAQGSKS